MKKAEDNGKKEVGAFERLIVDATPHKNAELALQYFLDLEAEAAYRKLVHDHEWAGELSWPPPMSVIEAEVLGRIDLYEELEEDLLCAGSIGGRALLVTQQARSMLLSLVCDRLGLKQAQKEEPGKAAVPAG